MKHFDTEQAIASLQRRLDKAAAHSKAIATRYTAITSGVYLDPRFWDSSKPVSTELPEIEYDFVSHYGRENLFVKTFDSGFGYCEYRTISKRTFARLEQLEIQLLNAWEKECDIAWQLRQIKAANPSLFSSSVA